jgi:hypothetical protein
MNKPTSKPINPVDPVDPIANAILQGPPSAPPPPTPPLEKPDPFDPARLTVSLDYAGAGAVKKLLTVIPVRKPGTQDWFRTHPAIEYRWNVCCIEMADEREFFIVVPEVQDALAGFTTTVTLFATMTTTRTLTLWPVKRPGPDGRENTAHKSASAAAERAITHWTRIQWNNHVKAYDQFETAGKIPDPEWPEISMRELVRIAFRDRLIEDLNHPVVRQLLGFA